VAVIDHIRPVLQTRRRLLADFMVGKTTTDRIIIPFMRKTRGGSTPGLNVNYGIRWEPYLPEHFKGALPNVEHFNMGLFLEGVKSTVFPNAPAGLMLNGDASMPTAASNIYPNWNVWSPRFGMGWDPRGNGRSTIRYVILDGPRVSVNVLLKL
jgi:hypothetical protein